MKESTLQYRLNSKAEREMPASNGKLCGKCLAISWNPEEHKGLLDQDGFENWTLNHYQTLSELETSCETGCPLCQTFFLLLAYDVMNLKDTDVLHWNVEHNRGLWSLTFDLDDPSPRDEELMWFMEGDDEIQASQSITMVKRFSSSSLDEDLRTLINESINPWIEACTRSGKHNSCPRHPPHGSESYIMPTRLIDVGSDAQSIARLVETTDLLDESKKWPYVILSYRWGLGNDPARTTSRNLKERRNEIGCDTLPTTIQDAIRITRLMKIQYLWVDAVCIVQSDKTLDTQQKDDVARADWERESMRMASYYANSLCCIAASNANDSSEGILSERRVARYGFEKWYNPANVFLPSPFALRRRFPSSLSDRGWCLQEWILSPRILHWTANGLIWECSDGFFWEGQRGFKGEPPECFGETRFECKDRKTNDCLLELGLSDDETQYICQILRSGKKEALGEGWPALVEHYAQMHLSFFSDRLAAVQGIAGVLSERHGVNYFAGIFESRCLEQLIWRSEDPQDSLDTSDKFPTWSWVSSRGEISFRRATSEDLCGTWMENLQRFPSSEHEKNLAHITNKELRFTAPLLKLDMLDLGQLKSDNTDSEDTDPEDPWPGRHRFSLGHRSPAWQGSTCSIHLDSLASSASFKSRAFLLLLRHLPFSGTEYQGLVLQMVEGAGKQELFHRRVGMFFVNQPGEYLQELPDLTQWVTKVILV